VATWEYTKDGYRVVLNYHVATSLVEYDAKVETIGRDPKPGEPKGRKWQVNFSNGVVTTIPDSKKMTPLGEEFMAKTLMAQNFVSDWVGKLNQSQWTEAYLYTLEPSAREPLRKNPKQVQVEPRSALAKLIRLDDKLFWAGKNQREVIKQRVHDTFQLGASGHSTFSLSVQQQAVPLLHESDGRTIAVFDIFLFYLDENAGTMQYMTEGRLVVSAANKDAMEGASFWRVDALDIDTGRSPPLASMQRNQPPSMTGREGGPRPR
jgi:hypothetical protein